MIGLGVVGEHCGAVIVLERILNILDDLRDVGVVLEGVVDIGLCKGAEHRSGEALGDNARLGIAGLGVDIRLEDYRYLVVAVRENLALCALYLADIGQRAALCGMLINREPLHVGALRVVLVLLALGVLLAGHEQLSNGKSRVDNKAVKVSLVLGQGLPLGLLIADLAALSEIENVSVSGKNFCIALGLAVRGLRGVVGGSLGLDDGVPLFVGHYLGLGCGRVGGCFRGGLGNQIVRNSVAVYGNVAGGSCVVVILVVLACCEACNHSDREQKSRDSLKVLIHCFLSPYKNQYLKLE